ncbi:MAG: winged helix-turn-helix domain-containing protein [Candidatus Micrarchaeota archaeon]|nr:winged helix-turn-helix domain-containing protein [Candidatus Micrarchaeota archaeon]
MKDIFLREKPCRMLLLVYGEEREWTITSLAKESGMVYQHASGLLKKLQERGIVKLEKVGRKVRVTKTEKGKALADSIESLMEAFKKAEAPAAVAQGQTQPLQPQQ